MYSHWTKWYSCTFYITQTRCVSRKSVATLSLQCLICFWTFSQKKMLSLKFIDFKVRPLSLVYHHVQHVRVCTCLHAFCLPKFNFLQFFVVGVCNLRSWITNMLLPDVPNILSSIWLHETIKNYCHSLH